MLEHARAKLARKGCDLLVVNDVSGGKVFGSDDNQAVMLDADGGVDRVPAGLEGGAGARDLGPGRGTLRDRLSLVPRAGNLTDRYRPSPHAHCDTRGTTTWQDAFSRPSR